MKSDIPILSEILTRIERIQNSGLDEERLRGSLWDQDAVIRNMEVIGEATKRLSKGARDLAPEVEWPRIAGFRDIAIHGYDRIDVGRVWVIVETELPRLKSGVRKLLSRLERGR